MSTALIARIESLEEENAELRKRCGEMASLLAIGIRTPNTDMMMGAVLSGGDVMGLAKRLSEHQTTPKPATMEE